MQILPTSFLPFWVATAEDHDMPRKPRAGLWAFLALCSCAAFFGFSYAPKQGGWYSTLSTPSWTPSDESFGLLWLAVYTASAFAGWRVWKTGAFRTVPFSGIAFVAHVVLCALWSTFFFGLQAPWLALAVLLALNFLSITLWLLYGPIDRLAFWLWLPVVLWSAFLALLNAAIAVLNA